MKKHKPIFKNTTKARIQIIKQGIPHWMEPGDTITGESYRVFMSLGLEEVGKEEVVVPKVPATALKPPMAVNDPKPEVSPITPRPSVDEENKVVSIDLVDDVIPSDHLKFNTGEELKDLIVQEIEMSEDDIIIIDDSDEPLVEDEKNDHPNKCDFEGCDKSFASKRGLKTHRRIHDE